MLGGAADRCRIGPDHDRARLEVERLESLEDTNHERLAAEVEQGLGDTHAGGAAGRQHNTGDRHGL